ncbi:hypothetical protein OSB04_013911 [Centaurea solstitialis]|uniref:Disease resistance protein n=1 Tax=Centaurea solstitialis TaxID=347529 RepID=A0AA38WFG4_9ASTR|nr:hypothetical protein OSB04_013911 [Centaurea solstitialis]
MGQEIPVLSHATPNMRQIMADAAVSFIVSDALWKLTSSTIQKYRLLHGVEDDVAALRNTLEQIQAVLEDAEVKQKKQKAVETWLKSLRSASLELENVLDEVSIEAMQQRLRLLIQRGIIYRVRAFFSSNYNQLRFRIKIIRKVKDIRRRLDSIAANRSNFNLSQATISVDARVGGDRKSVETSSLVHLSKTYGRDAEIEMITQKICNKDIARHHADDVRVYAIWGMGGVGKTTLAQLVYNHEKVATYFWLKCWVYVSAEFEIEKLTKGIIESIDGCRCELSQLDTMQVYLQKILFNKKFLIVFDDVWIDDWRKWEVLSKPLSCGVKGSIVMVTTRSKEISRMVARVPESIHKVGCLSEEDSWSLFKKLAFGVGREGEEDIRELEPIGKEMVKKCKGLPLAVKALGNVMWSKNSAVEWQRVKESDLWGLQGDEVQILPALELSYHNLPLHMKRCFAYCCLFPKGNEMAKDLLIHLWVTNGFIPSDGIADLYIIGEQIFSSLCQRSFFEDGGICKMHDMMHDLAQYAMRHDCSIIRPGKELIIPHEVLHLSSSCPEFVLSVDDSEKLRSVRSILIFAHEYKGNVSQIFEHKYLRVLHFIGVGGTKLPESIGKLKNLRYLNLSGSTIHFLPESIIYLQNLEVLILDSCMDLCWLPNGMRYLKNLHCLDISNCYSLLCMPVGIQELVSLRRLSNFIIHEGGTKIGELGDLNLLGCELKIQNLDYVQGFQDARSAKLSCKSNLISLVISWENWARVSTPEWEYYISRRQHSSSETVGSVLEGLEPNSNLKKLEIRDYPGEKISPSWMINLKSLVSIKFHNSDKCNHISALGRLPALKSVDINGMQNLRRLHDEDYTISADDILFPSLEILHIASCLNFISLPSNLPKLKQLTIKFCPALRSLPDGLQCLRELTRLEISRCEDLVRRCEKETGEDWPKISHVPDIHLS